MMWTTLDDDDDDDATTATIAFKLINSIRNCVKTVPVLLNDADTSWAQSRARTKEIFARKFSRLDLLVYMYNLWYQMICYDN